MRGLWTIGWIAAGLLAEVTPVRADNATEAKVRFDQGVELMRKGHIREALDEFFISNRISPNYNAAYNIASCLQYLKRYEEAFGVYTEYLAADLSPEERKAGEDALAAILPNVAVLEVVTDPPGAAIFLDRTNLGQYGTTPRLIAAPPGIHRVFLTLAEHHRVEESVTLAKGKKEKIDVKLAPITGKVILGSTPDHVSVFLDAEDGPKLGTTPLETDVRVGAHTFWFALAGYVGTRETAMVKAGEPVRLFEKLVPLPPPTGDVRILTNVASALVTIDGREAGFTPVVLGLPMGKHAIAVEKTGYRAWSGQVAVDPDRAVAIESTLEPLIQETGRGPWRWIFLSTGVAAGLAGGIVGLKALSVGRDYSRMPTQSLYDEGRTLNITADTLFGVAIAAGVATVAVWFLEGDQAARESSATVEYPETKKLARPPGEKQ